jgi:hypothetical protein
VTKIANQILNDQLAYNHLRTVGKVVKRQEGDKQNVIRIKDPLEESEFCLKIDVWLVKNEQFQEGRVYEFLGDI